MRTESVLQRASPWPPITPPRALHAGAIGASQRQPRSMIFASGAAEVDGLRTRGPAAPLSRSLHRVPTQQPPCGVESRAQEPALRAATPGEGGSGTEARGDRDLRRRRPARRWFRGRAAAAHRCGPVAAGGLRRRVRGLVGGRATAAPTQAGRPPLPAERLRSVAGEDATSLGG